VATPGSEGRHDDAFVCGTFDALFCFAPSYAALRVFLPCALRRSRFALDRLGRPSFGCNPKSARRKFWRGAVRLPFTNVTNASMKDAP